MAAVEDKQFPPPSNTFLDAVCDGGTPAADCELCGRTHFAAGLQSDADRSELKALRQKAAESPEKYIESSDDSIGIGHIDGKRVVWNCPCNKLTKYERFIWSHRVMILAYLKARARAMASEAVVVLSDIGDAAEADAMIIESRKRRSKGRGI